MAILRPTRRNVTLISWLWLPVQFTIYLPQSIGMAWRQAVEDVPHMIDTYRPFEDYDGPGRGPSVVSPTPKEGQDDG